MTKRQLAAAICSVVILLLIIFVVQDKNYFAKKYI
jgi:hypothetical protein